MTDKIPTVRSTYDMRAIIPRFSEAMFFVFPTEKLRFPEIFADMQEGYDNEVRRYHDWSHIQTMLEVLDYLSAECAGRLTYENRQTLTLAIFFHDVVMEFRRNDNEAMSARWFRRNIGDIDTNPPGIMEKIEAMILASTHKEPTNDFLTEIFLDIDLWGLGDPDFDRFYDTTARIRAEFLHTNDVEFMRGRIAWMESMLARERPIFYNPMRLNSLITAETHALNNLTTEISKFKEVLVEIDYLNRYREGKEPS